MDIKELECIVQEYQTLDEAVLSVGDIGDLASCLLRCLGFLSIKIDKKGETAEIYAGHSDKAVIALAPLITIKGQSLGGPYTELLRDTFKIVKFLRERGDSVMILPESQRKERISAFIKNANVTQKLYCLVLKNKSSA